MQSLYQVVYFAPSPVTEASFAIAALVRESKGLRVVRASRLPDEECLGGPSTAASMSMALDSLARTTELENLPIEIGQQVYLGDVEVVPPGTRHPAAWVARAVLPTRPDGPSGRNSSHPHRSTYGMRFFEHWGLRSYVGKNFRPSLNLPQPIVELSKTIDPISHWVNGSKRLLLMEPVVPGKDGLKGDLKRIGTRFLAYKGALGERTSLGREIQLIAYVLGGGSDDARSDALTGFGSAADSVYDTATRGRREAFVSLVREVGESGTPPSLV